MLRSEHFSVRLGSIRSFRDINQAADSGFVEELLRVVLNKLLWLWHGERRLVTDAKTSNVHALIDSSSLCVGRCKGGHMKRQLSYQHLFGFFCRALPSTKSIGEYPMAPEEPMASEIATNAASSQVLLTRSHGLEISIIATLRQMKDV